MPNYLSRMKPNGANGTEYKLKDEELREAFDVFKEDIKGAQTATGNPITLTDGSETYAQGLSVDLEPKQDLHGYDFPWVGGAGKNKLPLTVSGIKAANTHGTWNGNAFTFGGMTFTILTDESENITGFDIDGSLVGTAASRFVVSKGVNLAGSYLLNGGLSNSLYLQVTNYDETVQIDTNKGGDLEISNLDNYIIRFIVTATQSHTKVYPMLRLSTETDPTFAPWENICPISGYDGVEVDDIGVNQWDEEYAAGYLDANGAFNPDPNYLSSENFIPIRPNTQYYFYSGTYSNFVVFYYDNSQQLISYEPKGKNTTFTTPSNTAYIKFGNSYGEGSAYNNDISINYPATDTDYHPYQSHTASVTFGQTVYGGRSDFTEGGTDITKATETITSISARVGVKQFHITISGMKSSSYTVEDAISNEIPYNVSSYGSEVFGFVTHNGSLFIRLPFLEEDTKTAADNWLASNPLQLCYEKATPTTIATPKTDLKLLQDTNNITTNGTTISLDYIPNNSIGDAVKASEEYTDRAVEAVEKLIPQKTVLYDDVIEVGDEFDISIPSSFNFILFELTISSPSYYGTGSLMVTSWENTLTILTISHGLVLRMCELMLHQNRVEVGGDFTSEYGELKITAF